ncbi:MAG: indole-3-glycerol phosphate synthase TrpC [Acidobacteria bacterium]|nr:indole-3-glycerol phosphate synthase TrpC [Acidobacteriota bacterium]
MKSTVPTILTRIVARKQEELASAPVPLPELERRAADRVRERRDFAAALRSRQPALIAEAKKASPSKGLFRASFDPAEIARTYQAGGAAAMSVLTDRDFFQGSLADLEQARAAGSIPVLRKDFTISEYHVVEAAAHGADAILLIAAILDTAEMRRYRELAGQFGMAALVEVHDKEELDAAIGSGAEIIGVNNRNLHDFSVSLDTALGLAARIPAEALKVAESGIRTAADVRTLMNAGYGAFLVGEQLMLAENPAAELRALGRA